MNLNEYYTRKEVCELLGISKYRLRRMKFEYVTFGKRQWLHESKLEIYNVNERVKRQLNHVMTSRLLNLDKFIGTRELNKYWPYSRENLRLQKFHKVKLEKEFFYLKSDIKKYLLDNQKNISVNNKHEITEYADFDKWLGSVESW